MAVLFGSREIIRGSPKRAKTLNIAVGWLHCNIFNRTVVLLSLLFHSVIFENSRMP